MDYPFTVPGYEHVPLVLRTGLFSSAKIFYQDTPLEKTLDRKFQLTFSDGSVLVLGLKPGGFEFLPKVVHGDQVIEVAPKLTVYQQILIYLPMGLIVLGGAIGGLCGGLGTAVNVTIMRGSQSVPIKIGLSLATTFGAFVLWIVVAVVVTLAFRHR